jgi:hypothetical protein
MSKKSAPQPVDPAGLAAAQTGANKEAVRESATVNQINEVTPYGSLTYSGDIGSPDRTRTVSLNPLDQSTLDAQRGITSQLTDFAGDQVGTVRNSLSSPLSFDGLAPMLSDSDLMSGGKALEDATFQRYANLLNPEFARQNKSRESDLLTRGLPMGSEAYSGEMDRLQRGQNASLQDAALAAVTAGRNEQSRLAGLGQAQRNQGITERMTLRSQPMNELAALLQGAPAINTPQFGGSAQYQMNPADVMGASALQAQGQNAAYAAQMGQQNAALGGMFGLGAAGIGLL